MCACNDMSSGTSYVLTTSFVLDTSFVLSILLLVSLHSQLYCDYSTFRMTLADIV